ncbi:hypothetical protein BC832DRAFT_610350 [Gaertneriomyces semiglobifer]|nr:hypothetical protein BC832DRAFT_610350 [Gaertneriomyces semiglobifer]
MANNPGYDVWYSPDWCDWRWRISGCTHEGLWRGVYVAHTVITSLTICLGGVLLYKKFRASRAAGSPLLWMRTTYGGWQPRAAEAFLFFTLIHLFGRALYTALVLAGAFKSQAVTEFFHELPWSILYTGGANFNIGIVYATPRFKLTSTANSMTKISLPGPNMLNALLLIYSLVPLFTLPVYAAMDGHYRDVGDFERANYWNRVHYGSWSIYCWAIAALSLWWGIQLVRLLRSGLNKPFGPPVEKISMPSGLDRQHATNGTAGSGGRSEFKRAIIALIVNITSIVVMAISFGMVLGLYAILRVPIQSKIGWSALFGFVWIFISPLSCAPLYGVLLWNMLKSREEERSRSQLSGSQSNSQSAGDPRRLNSTLKLNQKSLPKPPVQGMFDGPDAYGLERHNHPV